MSLPDPIIELLPFWEVDGVRLLMILNAYVDESERPEDDILAVGGYLFTPDQYKAFEHDWQRVTNVTGGHPLHMSQIVNGKKPFQDMPLSNRVLAVEVAVDAINRGTMNGFGLMLSRAEARAIAPQIADEDIYSGLCVALMARVAKWLRKNESEETVFWTFGAGYAHQDKAHAVLSFALSKPELRDRVRSVGHLFDAVQSAGLQSGDVLSWAFTLAYIRRKERETGVAIIRNPAMFKPFLAELSRLNTDGPRYVTEMYDGEALVTFTKAFLEP